MNSLLLYRQAAGMGPPNTASVSFRRRVSTTTLKLPARSSVLITGSRLAMASIWPRVNADSAPPAAPTPTKDTSLGCRPALASTKLVRMLVDEPGAVTPILLPLRSATLL